MFNLSSGDVIRLSDSLLRLPKAKRQICVCPDTLMFLRINTNAFFSPHVMIAAADCDFLDHDSYVELRNVLHYPHSELEGVLADPNNWLGSLTPDVAEAIVNAARGAKTLPPAHKRLIEEKLWPFDY